MRACAGMNYTFAAISTSNKVDSVRGVSVFKHRRVPFLFSRLSARDGYATRSRGWARAIRCNCVCASTLHPTPKQSALRAWLARALERFSSLPTLSSFTPEVDSTLVTKLWAACKAQGQRGQRFAAHQPAKGHFSATAKLHKLRVCFRAWTLVRPDNFWVPFGVGHRWGRELGGPIFLQDSPSHPSCVRLNFQSVW
jgi:hypothetical protein